MRRPPSTTRAEDPETLLLARVYAAVLRWPCPDCGQPGPCPCDPETANGPEQNTTSATAVLGSGTEAGVERANPEGPTHGQD